MVSTAIILAAGEGSRLRSAAPLKPLCTLGGRSLLAHAISGLAIAGITRAVVVLGYGADEIEAYIAERSWPVTVQTAYNADYRHPNGTSVLVAEPLVGTEEALLVMCDHLVEPALYRHVAQAGASGGARLGVDRRIDSEWIDIEDVTRVRSENDRIVEIGKGISEYDCFDTGVFAIGPIVFDALRRLKSPSMTEAIRALAQRGSALTVDCGELAWFDVDDQSALTKAERWLGSSLPDVHSSNPGDELRRRSGGNRPS